MQKEKGKRQNGGTRSSRFSHFSFSLFPFAFPPHRHFAFCLLPFALALLPACTPPKADPAPPLQLPSYEELAQRYNANIAAVDQLWARASVKLFYRNQQGKWKTETGEDSLFMFQRPGRVALSLGKLGKTALWAGCDQQRYWLFDLIENRTAWVGSTAALEGLAPEDYPLPVHPQRLVALLGLTPLDTLVATDARTVRYDNGSFVIDAPAQQLRLWLDPATALPRQIILLGDDGQPRIWSKLSGELRVATAQPPPQETVSDTVSVPRLAARAELILAGTDGSLTLALRDATDARADPRQARALSNAFDFDTLTRALRPQHVIDLDEGRE